jgi:hypothetical protein
MKSQTITYDDRYQLEVTENGFTLWDNARNPKQWLVDASKINTDGEVVVSGYTMRVTAVSLKNTTYIARPI